MIQVGAVRRASRRAASAVGVFAAAGGLALSTVALVLPASQAAAVSNCASITSFTWTGLGVAANGNNKWSDSLNWTSLGVPAAPQPSSCVSLTFPGTASGTTDNDVTSLEITSLSIGGAYTLAGLSVFMGDSGAGATVTSTANASIGLIENLRNTATYNVSGGTTLTVSGQVLGSSLPVAITTTSGTGVLSLAGPNSYTGNTDVGSGTVQLTNPSALGASSNAVTVLGGATLELGPAGGISLPQTVTLAGGTLVGMDAGDQITQGVMLGSGGGTLSSSPGTSTLSVPGPISGTGPLTINSGTAGTVVFNGSTDNSYTGGTTVNGGSLVLDVNAPSGGLAAPGATIVNPGATIALGAPQQLDSGAGGALTVVGASALVDLKGNATSVPNLTLDSTSNSSAPTVESSTGAGTITVTSSLVSSGSGLPAVISAGLQSTGALTVNTTNSLAISGPLAGGNIDLTTAPGPNCTSGTSTAACVALVVSGDSPSYAGTVTVGAGVLDVTSNLSSASINVSGGTLTGTGTVATVSVASGTLAPGTTVATPHGQSFTDADNPGVLNVSTLSMSGGTFKERVDGPNTGDGTTPCTGYDQVNASGGSATLGGGAALSVLTDQKGSGAPCFIPVSNQKSTIISNPAPAGIFSGLPDGATVTSGGSFPYRYTIHYTGDVTLTSLANTTMTLSSTPNPSTYGEQVMFTAQVTPVSGTAPTGTVTFTDSNNGHPVTIVCQESGSNNNVVTISSDIAQCTPKSALPVGAQQTLTAVYSGDNQYPGNSATNSGAQGQTVTTQSTTTTLTTGSPSSSTYGQQVTFTATVQGNPVGTQAATVLPPTGSVTFSANGTALADCTTLSVATTSGHTTATCQTKDLPVGNPVSVTASYSGDSNYATSTTSTPQNQTVTQATTTTSLSTGNPSSSVFGQSVTFTATITPATTGPAAPTGTVTFNANGSALADCTAQPVSTTSGVTTATCHTRDLPVGNPNPVSVTADYTGDGNYALSSTTSAVSQTVNKASTTTTLISSVNPSAAGQQVTYTATVAAVSPGTGTPSGNVTFMDGANQVNCSPGTGVKPLSSGQATCTVTYGLAGQHSITVTYSGDGNFITSNSNTVIQNVVAGTTSTSITQHPASPSVYGQQVSFTATIMHTFTAAVAPTGNVTFAANGTTLPDCGAVPVSTSGTTTAVCNTSDLPVGNPVAVTATYNGDSNYAVSPTSTAVNQTVSQASTTTSLAAGSPNPSVFGQPVSFTATVTPASSGPMAPGGSVTFSAGGNPLPDCTTVSVSNAGGATTATCATSDLATGTDQVTAIYNGDGTNYSASALQSASQSQTVNKDASTVTVTSSANPAATGQNVTYTATVSAAVPGGGIATGTVEFLDPGTPIGGCTSQALTASGGKAVATCTVAFNTIGDRAVSAIYSGDANFTGSNSSSVIQRIVHSVSPAGYWMVASDGGIFSFGPGAHFYGSTGAQHLNAPIVGMAEDPATGGYWLVASDGGIFAFNAPFFGSTGAQHLNKPIVGMAAAPDGNGYWLVASDGGIFTFGSSAHFYGSTGAIHLNRPVVAMAAAPDGNGYWLVASDGGIFTFGPSATFFGSAGGTPLNRPIVGMAAAPDGNGYWLVASDGGIFSFGPSAQFFGSTGNLQLNRPIVGMAAAPDGNGYWLVASDGGIFTFGPSAGFYGSMGATRLNQPVVGMAAAG